MHDANPALLDFIRSHLGCQVGTIPLADLISTSIHSRNNGPRAVLVHELSVHPPRQVKHCVQVPTRTRKFCDRWLGVAQLSSRRVSMSGERSCQACHTPIASRLFAVLPSGVLLCFKCHQQAGLSRDPTTGRDFLHHPQLPSAPGPTDTARYRRSPPPWGALGASPKLSSEGPPVSVRTTPCAERTRFDRTSYAFD